MTEHQISRDDSMPFGNISRQAVPASINGLPLAGSAATNVPSMLDVPQAARLLGIGRTLAYELIRTEQWPTPTIRIGRLIKIPSGPLLELMTTGTIAPRRAAS